MRETFYITTAIDYPNGLPHMGHAYEKVVSDFYARYHALTGWDSYFLTGTDENGQKLKLAAAEAKKETMAYVDEYVAVFKTLCQNLNIDHDDFIRTTEDRHRRVVHTLWRTLKEKDFIYWGKYTGLYCVDCESFYSTSQLEDRRCPHHNKEVVERTEEGYFFKLGHFRDWITSWIKEQRHFIVPDGPRNEVLSRLVNEPLKDISISRPDEGWGIPVPDDDRFVIYTWFDALINYYSALEGGKKKYWPASCHVIGRDIVWFHCVIWPCMLKAAHIPLPRQVYVHGMVLGEDGRKMSKSLGNGVDPMKLLETYNLDSFRFYMLKSLPAHGNGKFAVSALADVHNNLLANDWGNLVMRVVKMALSRLGARISLEGLTLEEEFHFGELRKTLETSVCSFEHDKALEAIWQRIQGVNRYINEKKPWSIKEESKTLASILQNALYAIHALSYLLYPAMPESSRKVLTTLGVTPETNPFENPTAHIYQLSDPPLLFKKIVP